MTSFRRVWITLIRVQPVPLVLSLRSVPILQTCTYRPQKRHDGSAFALAYIFRLSSCKSSGAFIISPLPPMLPEESQSAGPLRSVDVTPPRRYFGPIRLPLVVARFPGLPGYTVHRAPAISRRDEEGLSSCSAHPCYHAVANHPAGVTHRFSHFATRPAAFAHTLQARPPVQSENAVGLQLPQPVRRVGREEQPARSRNVNRGLD